MSEIKICKHVFKYDSEFDEQFCKKCDLAYSDHMEYLRPTEPFNSQRICEPSRPNIEDALNARIKELELKLAKMLSKQDTLRCYMCEGSNYLEWVDWDTFDEDHKQKYIKQAEEK